MIVFQRIHDIFPSLPCSFHFILPLLPPSFSPFTCCLSDNELKEGGLASSNDQDIIHRGAFGGGSDDGFGTRARDLGLPSSIFRAMPTSSSTSNNTNNMNGSVSGTINGNGSNLKEGSDRPVAGILKLDPSIIAELRDEWGEDEDDEEGKSGQGQIENSSGSNESSNKEVVSSSRSDVVDVVENDISDAAKHGSTTDGLEVATVDSATESSAVLNCGGGGVVDGLQAAIEEVKTAPPAPPATYRRLQLAPRTLPLSMPPMPVKVPATASAETSTKSNSSSSKSNKTSKNVKTHSHNETTKPVGNAFLMLGDDDDDDINDDETKEEPNNERKQDLHIDDEDNDLITALLASEMEEINHTSVPSDVPPITSGWSCKTCTLINEEAENECKACGTPSSNGDDAAWQTAK